MRGLFKLGLCLAVAIGLGIMAGRQASSAGKRDRNVRQTVKSTVRGIEFPKAVAGLFTSPKPGQLTVNATAHLSSTVVTEDMVWVLAIRHPTTHEVIGQTTYDHQVFTLRAGQSMNPTFTESLEMPPGFYAVTVGIKGVRPALRSDGSTEDSWVTVSTFYETVK